MFNIVQEAINAFVFPPEESGTDVQAVEEADAILSPEETLDIQEVEEEIQKIEEQINVEYEDDDFEEESSTDIPVGEKPTFFYFFRRA